MRTRVFEPLGMKATTFDYARALKGNHAFPPAPDIDGKPAKAAMEINYAVIPLRPAGAAWSNVRDLLKYVTAELGEGVWGRLRLVVETGLSRPSAGIRSRLADPTAARRLHADPR